MKLQERIETLAGLRKFMLGDDESWLQKKQEAGIKNSWFTPEFISASVHNIVNEFLDTKALADWAAAYGIPDENTVPKTVGVVMAGNIPLVGFHDFLSVFISGNKQVIKLSSKDDVLLKFLVQKMTALNPAVAEYVRFEEMLKGCDAYIATGSDNSSRYFEYYFSKYPNIIRRNRTSVAILDGNETAEDLEKLADDIHLYFGLGCRNVTKIYVPKGYDFIPLLNSCRKYNYFIEHHRYKNNFDYNLAIHILNNKFYMSNDHLLLIEDASVFSPISQLNYEYYDDLTALADALKNNENIQCITGSNRIGFGKAQQPSLTDYADGVDTMKFLVSL